MQTTNIIQKTPSWQLEVCIEKTPYGHHLAINSLVPTARRPERQEKFSGTFSIDELLRLRDAINLALGVKA